MAHTKVEIEEYLDRAQIHAAEGHHRAEGYWIGRAVEIAHRNSIEAEWFDEALRARGLDETVEQWDGKWKLPLSIR